MKAATKKDRKTKRQTKQENAKPAGKPAAKKTAKATEAAPAQQRTIKQVVIESIAANSQISNNDMIAAVKAEFPKSAFDAKHASWYRSQARKGLLTGTPISIPPQTSKKQKSAASDTE